MCNICRLQATKLGQTFKYRIQWSAAGPGDKSIVVVTSRPRPGHPRLAVTVWTSHPAHPARGPVRVFARVRRGRAAVLRAEVRLEAALETAGGARRELGAAVMEDSGDGALDLVAGDGVYSGWLEAAGDGRYITRVTVTAGPSAVQTRGEQLPRCGSGPRTPDPDLVTAAPPFTRSVAGPVLQLRGTASMPPVPLRRATDLAAASNSSGAVSLAWSCARHPGPGLGYTVLYSADIADLLVAASPRRQVLAHINVTAAETRVNVSLQLPRRGGDFYLAVVATSHSGLRAPSPLSNIVTVSQLLAAPPSPRAAAEAAAGADPLSLRLLSSQQWVVVGVAGGVVAVLLCLTATLLVWVTWARPAPATCHVSSSGSSDTADTVLDTADSLDLELKPPVVDISPAPAPAPSPAPRVAPVYWSASQLLARLEGCSGPAPSPQGVLPRPRHVPEEFCVTVTSLPAPTHRHPPPPVLPKPKNVTQV